MLVNSKKIVKHAQKHGYAVPHFNIHSLDNMRAVIEAASEMNSPVIVAATPMTFDFCGGIEILWAAAKKLIQKHNNIPISFHMDHNHDYKQLIKAMELGIKSVMIDASSLSFEENVKITKRVVEAAKKFDASVEAELGVIAGTEDNVTSAKTKYSDPKEVKKFCEDTNVDQIAVAIGNAHGRYLKIPVIKTEILSEISEICSTPTVLHGASGLTEKQLRNAIKAGCSKINFGTELKVPFVDALKEWFKNNPKGIDPRQFLQAGVDAIKTAVKKVIVICNSQNKY